MPRLLRLTQAPGFAPQTPTATTTRRRASSGACACCAGGRRAGPASSRAAPPQRHCGLDGLPAPQPDAGSALRPRAQQQARRLICHARSGRCDKRSHARLLPAACTLRATADAPTRVAAVLPSRLDGDARRESALGGAGGVDPYRRSFGGAAEDFATPMKRSVRAAPLRCGAGVALTWPAAVCAAARARRRRRRRLGGRPPAATAARRTARQLMGA
jgi:hypothetical protein